MPEHERDAHRRDGPEPPVPALRKLLRLVASEIAKQIKSSSFPEQSLQRGHRHPAKPSKEIKR